MTGRVAFTPEQMAPTATILDSASLVLRARGRARQIATTNPNASLRLQRQADRLEKIIMEQRRLRNLQSRQNGGGH
ncbi:hypothetical protein HAP94_02080 [Acidithiobacillus ferrivorans]|nr:hypothetical protein [Acidithiobacillus ferrivorans]